MKVSARAVASLCTALLVAGCASSPASRFYTLASPVPITAAPAATAATPAVGSSASDPRTAAAGSVRDLAVSVGPVAIPAVVDRPEFVITVGPNEVWLDEFNRWAGPLADAIGLAIVGHLSVLLPSPNVTLLSQSPGGAASTRVAVEVQRFDSVPGSHALVDALFTVSSSAGDARTGRTTAREPVDGASYDALAAAHSRAVARLSRDIATAINGATIGPAATSPAR